MRRTAWIGVLVASPGARTRVIALSVLLVVALAGLAGNQGWLEPVVGPLLTRIHRVDPQGPTVIFVVLDTVRADHLRLCGYDRPTSPTLDALVAQGSLFTCGGVSPATWTLPSHATFFTGVDTWVHRADFLAGPGQGTPLVRPLGPELSTLAEQMRASGYQTAAVSGNPLLHGTGLLRGFDLVNTATTGFERAPQVHARLRSVLRFDVAAERPLFLFVNLADAHDPWTGVPSGLGWGTPTGWYTHERGTNPDGEFTRFIEQQMAPGERAAFLSRVRDLYDVGVLRADAGLGGVLRILGEHGWLSAGYRLVVTSDHGENLGEGDLLDHGRYCTEEAVRVPVLFREEPGQSLAGLPSPLWAGHVFELVRDGRLPETLEVPHAVSLREKAWENWFERPLGEEDSVAVYEGETKLLQQGDRTMRFDLASDPMALVPLPVVEGALVDVLRATAASLASLDTSPTQPVDPEVTEALRAVGYLE